MQPKMHFASFQLFYFFVVSFACLFYVTSCQECEDKLGHCGELVGMFSCNGIEDIKKLCPKSCGSCNQNAGQRNIQTKPPITTTSAARITTRSSNRVPSSQCQDRSPFIINCEYLTPKDCQDKKARLLGYCDFSCDWCTSPIIGKWSVWSKWDPEVCPCIKATRKRECSPLGTCSGSSKQEKVCDCNKDDVFPNNHPWTAWFKCNRDCGTGRQYKIRRCIRGRSCGRSIIEYNRCNEHPCGNYRWGNWMVEECSVTCGDGVQRRQRNCESGECLGEREEVIACSKTICRTVHENPFMYYSKSCLGVWSAWKKVGVCSVTCGNGKQQWERNCVNGNNCEGASNKLESCLMKPCIRKGVWSEWESVGPCSVTCEIGKQRFLRNCENGDVCDGNGSEFRPCVIDCRPIWNEWSPWSDCSATCGKADQVRKRNCKDGNRCAGENLETRACQQLPKCKGEWCEWKSSPCTVTCGEGKLLRRRECCGENCDGIDKEIKICQMPPCKEVPKDWSDCSVTCGLGYQERTTCNSGTCSKEWRECETKSCPTANCAGRSYGYGDLSRCCTIRDGACGSFNETYLLPSAFDTRIFGGKNAKPWPWMISIIINRNTICGGTLLSKDWVLTAAHCVSGIRKDSISPRGGDISYLKAEQRIVKKVICHPDYKSSSPVADLCLLQLNEQFSKPNVKPICLPNGEKIHYESQCIALGWGRTPKGIVETLQEVKLSVYPTEVCKSAYANATNPLAKNMDNTHICAGRLKGGIDTCEGDSGGPLLCQRKDSCDWYLAAVTTFGTMGCGIPEKPGVFADMLLYEDWINNILN